MIKKILSHIMCIITTILIFLLEIIVILNNTILNQDYILQALDSHNFYETTYHQVVDNFEGYIMSTGLDKDIANTFITQDKIKQDINILINNVYQNKNTNIDTTSISDAIDKSINDKISQTGKQLTTEDQQNINTFKEAIQETYLNNINYFQKYLTKITKIYQSTTQILKTITLLTTITVLIISLIIIIINRNIKKSVKYIITSLLSSSILSIIIGLLLNKKYNKILVFNKEFTKIVVDTLNDIFTKLFTYGLIISIINIVILIIINKPEVKEELTSSTRSKNKRKEKTNK